MLDACQQVSHLLGVCTVATLLNCSEVANHIYERNDEGRRLGDEQERHAVSPSVSGELARGMADSQDARGDDETGLASTLLG